ncbi:MAG: uncharacterized protein KVP18_001930 [Porospora cf. gigantea A]|uniref:uncharacterized protein n=1 Tax=Porospora cf. gigantea A TaxID=2853593 RepID=UPI00355A79C0|nr:MAG: hypothetical protein KVP18_001930 [Porospora cf. gigantea A]
MRLQNLRLGLSADQVVAVIMSTRRWTRCPVAESDLEEARQTLRFAQLSNWTADSETFERNLSEAERVLQGRSCCLGVDQATNLYNCLFGTAYDELRLRQIFESGLRQWVPEILEKAWSKTRECNHLTSPLLRFPTDVRSRHATPQCGAAIVAAVNGRTVDDVCNSLLAGIQSFEDGLPVILPKPYKRLVLSALSCLYHCPDHIRRVISVSTFFMLIEAFRGGLRDYEPDIVFAWAGLHSPPMSPLYENHSPHRKELFQSLSKVDWTAGLNSPDFRLPDHRQRELMAMPEFFMSQHYSRFHFVPFHFIQDDTTEVGEISWEGAVACFCRSSVRQVRQQAVKLPLPLDSVVVGWLATLQRRLTARFFDVHIHFKRLRACIPDHLSQMLYEVQILLEAPEPLSRRTKKLAAGSTLIDQLILKNLKIVASLPFSPPPTLLNEVRCKKQLLEVVRAILEETVPVVRPETSSALSVLREWRLIENSVYSLKSKAWMRTANYVEQDTVCLMSRSEKFDLSKSQATSPPMSPIPPDPRIVRKICSNLTVLPTTSVRQNPFHEMPLGRILVNLRTCS